MNYTRPTPLPCRDTAHGWAPRWFDGKGRPRFIIYAWWPPATPDFGAYADAGFNLALTENALGGVCQRKGPNATVTHDELFDANVAAANALSALGILTVFSTGNDCNAQLATSPTVAYGNATVTLTLTPTLTLTLTVTVTVTVTLTLSLSLTLTLTRCESTCTPKQCDGSLCKCHTASAEELRRDDRGGDDEVPTRGFKMTCTPTDPTSQISVDWCEATCGENPAGCDPALCECKQQPARSALAA